MRKVVAKYWFLALVSGSLIGLDQLTKAWVRGRLAYGASWAPIEELAGLLRIVHWSNTGAAFGLLPSGGLLFGAVAAIVSGAIIFYFPRIQERDWLLRTALALQLAGALGNMVDRLHQGTVTDFVAVGNFPVFNLADASIFTGLVLLILATWRDERAQKAREARQGGMSEDAEAEVG